MASTNWTEQANHYLKSELPRYRAINDPERLQTAVLDAHTTLDMVLRTYLVSKHDARFVLEKTEVNFPKLINITQKKTSARIIKAGEADLLHAFGQLRNRIAHEKAIPTVQKAQQGIELVGVVMRRGQTRSACPTIRSKICWSISRSTHSRFPTHPKMNWATPTSS